MVARYPATNRHPGAQHATQAAWMPHWVQLQPASDEPGAICPQGGSGRGVAGRGHWQARPRANSERTFASRQYAAPKQSKPWANAMTSRSMAANTTLYMSAWSLRRFALGARRLCITATASSQSTMSNADRSKRLVSKIAIPEVEPRIGMGFIWELFRQRIRCCASNT